MKLRHQKNQRIQIQMDRVTEVQLTIIKDIQIHHRTIQEEVNGVVEIMITTNGAPTINPLMETMVIPTRHFRI